MRYSELRGILEELEQREGDMEVSLSDIRDIFRLEPLARTIMHKVASGSLQLKLATCDHAEKTQVR